MIDRLSTWGESHRRGRGETLPCSSSVNKQQEALLEAAKGDAVLAVAALSPRRRPEPQINRALPHDRGVSFGTVTLHKAPQKWGVHWGPRTLPQESPNNLCDCYTAHFSPTFAPPSLKLQGKALPMLILVQLPQLIVSFFLPFKACRTYPVAPVVCKLLKTSQKYFHNNSDDAKSARKETDND